MKPRITKPIRIKSGRLHREQFPQLIDARCKPIAFHRIVVPTDFSKASIEAFGYAIQLASSFGAAIHLVYVIERPPFVNDLQNVPLVLPESKLARAARAKLSALGKKATSNDVEFKTHITIGKPFSEITQLAEQIKADLIVIATHGHKGLQRLFLGSTTEQVLRHAPCPVLVMRRRSKTSTS